ncbi:two-component regulator propeller domain-containing protein [Labilibaculum manganireducens]|uniref:hybrid sensor histidine kinase/response regulator transcription factor n=1 Tax=Labilibaculum manganireducens TaxID=1940525 RepID=UPI0029F5A950|nr:two-component regulator propeller domain-containing protein [Labilibaculum manganireducens]
MKFLYLQIILSLFILSVSAQNEMSFDSFSQDDGFPSNQIQCIHQDQKGWMWFGTSQGLSRFDGYRFVNYLNSPEDSLSLSGILVRVIFEDRKGNLLVGTENGGLNVFDRELELFHHPYNNNPLLKSKDVSVNDIREDDAGNIWLGTNTNILKIDSLGTVSVVSLGNDDATNEFNGEFVRVLQFDNLGRLWAGTNNGVFIIDTESKKVDHVDLPFENGDTDEIWEIFLDLDGSMWIGTYFNGAFIVDPVSMSVKPVILNPSIERTETVRTISVGAFGNYWIGTRGGLYLYNKTKATSDFYRNDDREPSSLINNSVLDIIHDKQGEAWIGTRGGLNLLAKNKQVFHNFKAHLSDNKYLNSSFVYALWVDDENNIWLGTEDGGVNIYHPETKSYTYLKADAANPNSISKNCIKAFQEDQEGNLWIGTFGGGIDVLNLKTNKIKHYINDPFDSRTLADNRVWDLLLDREGDVWVCTSLGIDRFDSKTKEFIHYPQLAGQKLVTWVDMDSQNNIWLGTSDEIIVHNQRTKKITRFKEHSRSFTEDTQGRCWIATLDKGIVQYSDLNGPVKYYNKTDGLANNQALRILEDGKHFLWISTSNGLSKFNVESNTFCNFTSHDGLGNNQFTYGAAYKSSKGDLLFCSISGFTIFDPSEVKCEENQVPLVLTELRIFNKKIGIGSGKNSVLKKSISETNHLVLNYDQNVFTLEFAALNYIKSTSNLYSYYLEGFDKGWNEPSADRTATYTNLNPGDYVLHIKRVVIGNPENNNELRFLITILPPFWKTLWFRFIGLIILGTVIYFLIQFFIYRGKMKNELVLERMKARKLHELDTLKLKFFTNISHEIRTPLTLILTPLEKLISQKMPPHEVNSYLDVMYRNTTKLDRLISQLLDFRKLESGNLKLELAEGDIVRFISGVVQSFESYAAEKGIDLRFNTLKERLVTRFDADKIEKILNNLLSNAFKFTEKEEEITVNLSLVFDTNEENTDGEFIEIVVRDTGQGISEINVPKIFNRFFQANKEDVQTGTGIGLAFVKELVKLHKGEIFVVSKPGKGSKFTIRIPYEKEVSEVVSGNKTAIPSIEPNAKFVKEKGGTKNSFHSKIMLIVEDNLDVRAIIKSHFTSKYQVLEANDGKEGWKLALINIPDIIISDVLMPDVDGYEFCKRVKKDERTSHIPVLFLTALHSKESEIKGLLCGADDYITKPFDLAVLQTKIDNMLLIRDSLKEKFSNEMVLLPKNIIISSPDEKFLQKAVEVVENNIADTDLDIERFSREVGVSRMQLYRKLDALTDMTVKEFIRSIRLKRASQLLEQESMSISEIAYAVGFKDLSHFRKCFRQMYGMNATEYKQKK